jgi:hypothetical protein
VGKDLAVTAAANSSTVRAGYDRAVAADVGGTLAAFAAQMADCVASTSVHQYKVTAIATAGQLISRRGILRSLHPGSTPAQIEQRFSAADKEWYTRRTAFEDHWIGGREFLYLSLIRVGLGYAGFGGEDFGTFAIVLSDRASALAVFPGNTAKYAEADGTLDVPRCEAGATAWTDRALRLTLKHEHEIAVVDPSKWDALISRSSDDATEVIMGAPVDLDLIAEIRVDADLLATMDKAVAEQWGEDLSEDELAMARVRDVFAMWQQQYGVVIVGV